MRVGCQAGLWFPPPPPPRIWVKASPVVYDAEYRVVSPVVNVRVSFLHAVLHTSNDVALLLPSLARGRERSEKGSAAPSPKAGGIREGQGVYEPLGGGAECRRRRYSYGQAA